MATPAQVQQKVLKVPFQIGERGEVAFVTQPNVVAAQEIKAALLTMTGERLMRSHLGSAFGTAVFLTFPSSDSEFIESELASTLMRHVRYSTVHYVRLDFSTPGTLKAEVGYTPIAVDNNVFTVTVPLFTATVDSST